LEGRAGPHLRRRRSPYLGHPSDGFQYVPTDPPLFVVLVLAHCRHGILFRNIRALRAIVLSANPARVRHDYAVRQWLRSKHTCTGALDCRRRSYWNSIEVLYFSFYAYEEILAVIAERQGQTATLLSCMENLSQWISQGAVSQLRPIAEPDRRNLLSRFTSMTSALPSQSRHRSTVARIYLSYSHADFRGKFSSLAREIKAKLPESRVFWDEEIPFGVNRKDALDEELERADIVVIFCGENSLRSDHIKREVNTALRSEKQVVPVLLTDHASWEDLPSDLQNIRGARLDTADWSNHLPVLIGACSRSQTGCGEQHRPGRPATRTLGRSEPTRWP
jgi:TIR domain-containing protein